jgi:hypothetical protein
MTADQRREGSLSSEAAAPDPAARVARIERNTTGQLVAHLVAAAEPVPDVRLARYFPWSMPDAYVSVRTGEGREIAVLTDLDELDPASRKVVESELRDKIFNPKILRILEYKHEFGITSITAETDRGEVIFQFRGRHDIRLLSPTRALIRDVDSNTYELPDFNRLDPTSRRYLQRYF